MVEVAERSEVEEREASPAPKPYPKLSRLSAKEKRQLEKEFGVFERMLVIAAPRSFFVWMPRRVLYETFSAEARFTPKKTNIWRALIAGGTGLLVGLVCFVLFLPFSFYVHIGFVGFLAQMFGLLAGVYMLGPGFKRHIYRRFLNLQPLWCVMRVTDTWTFTPVTQPFDDGEGNTVEMLVDITVTNEPLKEPKLVPVTPRALVQEARPSGDPEDKGVQRADYFYLALNPSDLKAWFTRAGSRFGTVDAVIGGGYLVGALIAVFLFVQVQGGG